MQLSHWDFARDRHGVRFVSPRFSYYKVFVVVCWSGRSCVWDGWLVVAR